MAKKWLYFPFDDISKDPSMPGNRTRYEEKYKADLTVAMKGQSLQTVGDNDMFIIAGHGLPHVSRIGVTTGPPQTKAHKILGINAQTTMTAHELADQLVADGLPFSHRYIKLITCGGAGMVSVDDAKAATDIDWHDPTNAKGATVTVERHAHETECLASVLAAALGRRGYQTVLVKGYPGFVNANNAQKTVRVEGTSVLSQVREIVELVAADGTESKVEMNRAERNEPTWKGGTVGMVRIPSKYLNDFWFDSTGQLQRQHISLKA